MGFDGISRRQHASCKCFLVDDKKKKEKKKKTFQLYSFSLFVGSEWLIRFVQECLLRICIYL
jgi:hypothetical protein